jgi:hypothetical protein
MSELREAWLDRAMRLIMEQVFAPHELRFAPLVKISVGMCPGKAIGVCYSPEGSDDGAIHIFVTPELGNDDVMKILGVVTHELVHAHLYSEGYFDVRHSHPFPQVSKQVGLEGKPKCATAVEGTELWATLEGMAVTLGDYPHAPLRKTKEPKKKLCETITWISETDPDYEVKAKLSMIQEKGAPKDFDGKPMVAKDPEKLAEVEAALEARAKADVKEVLEALTGESEAAE